MASRVVMPKLTDTMEEGVLLEWKKREGDPVQAGEALAEIETDKAVMDLEAFASGILRKILVQNGETVESGKLLGVIGEADEDITEALSDTIMSTAATSAKPAAAPSTSPAPSPMPTEESRIIASPRARALAAKRGVDLSTVTGTGPSGRIVEEDVANAQEPAASALPAGTDQPLTQMRKAIAKATVQSKAPVPHFYLTREIEMEAAEEFRRQFKKDRQSHPSMTDLLIKAVALALRKHPDLNVSYVGDAIRRYERVDIGVAVGLEDGLITPVIRDCGAKTLEAISAESRELIERAKQKRLQPQEYSGATFSISNLGMFGVDNFLAVLIPPQAASLAVGAVRDVPVIVAGTVKAGRSMQVTLSCDHRAIDGVTGARFLTELKRLLEDPHELASSTAAG
jgi:pyruvate dehydrogenase E2 component (dihydrolipoamide acetyltransferase)